MQEELLWQNMDQLEYRIGNTGNESKKRLL